MTQIKKEESSDIDEELSRVKEQDEKDEESLEAEMKDADKPLGEIKIDKDEYNEDEALDGIYADEKGEESTLSQELGKEGQISDGADDDTDEDGEDDASKFMDFYEFKKKLKENKS